MFIGNHCYKFFGFPWVSLQLFYMFTFEYWFSFFPLSWNLLLFIFWGSRLLKDLILIDINTHFFKATLVLLWMQVTCAFYLFIYFWWKSWHDTFFWLYVRLLQRQSWVMIPWRWIRRIWFALQRKNLRYMASKMTYLMFTYFFLLVISSRHKCRS